MSFGEILREQPVEEKEEKIEISVPDKIFVDTGYDSPRPEDEKRKPQLENFQTLLEENPNLANILISAINYNKDFITDRWLPTHLGQKVVINKMLYSSHDSSIKPHAADFLVGAGFMYGALKQANGEHAHFPKIEKVLAEDISNGVLVREIQCAAKKAQRAFTHEEFVDSKNFLAYQEISTLFKKIEEEAPNIYKSVMDSHLSDPFHNTGAFLTFAILKYAEEKVKGLPSPTKNSDTPPNTPEPKHIKNTPFDYDINRSTENSTSPHHVDMTNKVYALLQSDYATRYMPSFLINRAEIEIMITDIEHRTLSRINNPSELARLIIEELKERERKKKGADTNPKHQLSTQYRNQPGMQRGR